MPQGDKGSYTSKQKRQASHIEQSAKRRGRSSRTAARIAWATVNKQDGGGKKGSRKATTRRGGRSRGSRTRRTASRRPSPARNTRTRSARSASSRRVRA